MAEGTSLDEVMASPEFKAAVQQAVDAEVEGLKAKNHELLGENRKLKRLARGADVNANADLEDMQDQLKTLQGELKKATEARTRDKDTAAKQVQSLAQQLDAAVIDSTITRAVAGHKGIPTLLEPFVRSRVARQEVDGKQVAVVLGEDGKPRLKEGATNGTDFLSVQDFVGSLKEQDEFKGAFQGTGTSGSGSLPGRGTGGDQHTIPNTPDAITRNLEKVAKGEIKVEV